MFLFQVIALNFDTKNELSVQDLLGIHKSLKTKSQQLDGRKSIRLRPIDMPDQLNKVSNEYHKVTNLNQ